MFDAYAQFEKNMIAAKMETVPKSGTTGEGKYYGQLVVLPLLYGQVTNRHSSALRTKECPRLCFNITTIVMWSQIQLATLAQVGVLLISLFILFCGNLFIITIIYIFNNKLCKYFTYIFYNIVILFLLLFVPHHKFLVYALYQANIKHLS